MKEQTTNERNLAMLKGFLAGKDYETLAEENNLSGKSSAYQCVTTALQLLHRFGCDDIPKTGAGEYLMANKDKVLEAIKKTKLPKTTLHVNAHHYLVQEYGSRYPRKAKKVATEWSEKTGHHFRGWGNQRERNSILAWLASEGYFLENFLDAEHKRILFSGVIDMLNNKNSKQQGNTIVMGDIEHSAYGGVVADITIKGEKVTAQRRIKIELIDA